MNEIELYIHIPFCKKKCNYCDFVSFAGCEDQIGAYVDALVREIEIKAPLYRDRQISTIYIGGGTPSLLNRDQISRVVETLNKEFNIEGTHEKRRGLFLQKKIRPVTEFSIECNPGTIDKEKLKTYKQLGINRLSMGLQSADNEDLKVLGRIHTFEDFVDSFEAAREAGFDNINVDLMQAIPGQTMMGWKRVLAMLCTFKPEHISAYSLIIEDGTEFKRMADAGHLMLPDEDTERDIYHYTKEFLESTGYQRYEISNYAVPGYECRHNIGYWTRANYLGLGLNASSMIDNVRWKNTAELEKYISYYNSTCRVGHPGAKNISKSSDTAVSFENVSVPQVISVKNDDTAASFKDTLVCQDTSSKNDEDATSFKDALVCQDTSSKDDEDAVIEEKSPITYKEQIEEFMFLGLRMSAGVSRQKYFDSFGQDMDVLYGEELGHLKSLGLIEESEGNVRLTDKGVDVSNVVLARFLLDEEA